MSTTNTTTSFIGKHTFTSEEKEQKLQQMLTAMREKEEIEAEFKTTKSNYKSKIDAKDGEIKLTSNLLNAGWENKTYQCTLVKNFDEGKRQYFELGTNLLVGEESLTAADYQMQLDMDNKAIKANNDKADLKEVLLPTGEEPEQIQLSAEGIAMAEEYPQDSVEPGSNPLELNDETPAVEPEVISKPTKQKEVKTKTGKTGTQSLNEHLSADDYDDPFSNIGSRDSVLDLGNEMDNNDEDPFSFGDI